MVRTSVKVVLLDLVLLLSAYFVLQDLAWRTSYAAYRGFSPSFSYSVLTQFLTMTDQNDILVSPPTLDWIQLLVVVFAAANIWFIYKSMRAKGPKAHAVGTTSAS